MSHIKVEAITSLSREMNTASNLQQAITGAAQFNEKVMQAMERKKEEEKKKKQQEKQTAFKFDPKDIQTLVYRPNKVKDSLMEQMLQTEERKKTKEIEEGR